MLSQTFCYWGKQQSPDSNVFLFHTLKCTKVQSSHFCDCFLVSKLTFQHHDRGLTKFHAGSEQLLLCVDINNSSCPTVKHNNTAYHAFGKYWMQARGFLSYRSKYCLPNVFTVYVNLRKKRGGQIGGQAKIWGRHGPLRPPLELPLLAPPSYATAEYYLYIFLFLGSEERPWHSATPVRTLVPVHISYTKNDSMNPVN